jgi:hypothetical protein
MKGERDSNRQARATTANRTDQIRGVAKNSLSSEEKRREEKRREEKRREEKRRKEPKYQRERWGNGQRR